MKSILNSYSIAVTSIIATIIVACSSSSDGSGSSGSTIRDTGYVTAVATGISHTLVIKNDGTVWSFGSNQYGELGLDNTIDYNKPQQITSLGNDASAVAAYRGFSLVLKHNGSLWSFGNNSSGELGLGNNDPTSTPTEVMGLVGGVKSIAVGFNHSLVIKNDGTLWAFGGNRSGQLGLGNRSDTNKAMQVTGDISNDVKAVAGGYGISLVLKQDGTVWVFGDNRYGQLSGIAVGDYITTAQKVTSIDSTAQAIATYASSSLILKADGTVWAFGSNEYGQLGLGATVGSAGTSTAKQIIGDASKDVQAISAGQYSSLVLKKDGTVWAFGLNNYGQLGLGTNENTNTAKQVIAFGNSAQSVLTGNTHSMVIKNDGTLWAFGGNTKGQLGIGNNDSTSTPTKVIFP